MTPGRDAFVEQRLHFLAESDLVDEELDLMRLECSTSSIVQQESRPDRLRKQGKNSNDTQLVQNWERAFSSLRDLGNGWWLFSDGPDWTFKAHIYYEGVSSADRAASTVRDLWLPTDHAITPWEFRFSLKDFLQQFYSLPRRWGWEFEPLTEDIILASALWQECCFVQSTLMPTHTHTEATLVAASLRCLVISNEINHVSGHWSTSYFQREHERYVRLADVERDPRGEDTGIRPAVEVWRLEDDSQLPDSVPPNRERLPQMIQRTIQMAQRLLHRGRPKDWPSVFYVLCILWLVHGGVDAHFWTDATDQAAMEIEKALRKLCRLFHLTTGNMQPLNSDFDIQRYAKLVDDNELAVVHYKKMHQLWIDNKDGDEDEEDADDLWSNLDTFIHGMML